MLPAFRIDQVRPVPCGVPPRGRGVPPRARAKRPQYLWEKMRSVFPLSGGAPDRETLYALATKDGAVAVAVRDTPWPGAARTGSARGRVLPGTTGAAERDTGAPAAIACPVGGGDRLPCPEPAAEYGLVALAGISGAYVRQLTKP